MKSSGLCAYDVTLRLFATPGFPAAPGADSQFATGLVCARRSGPSGLLTTAQTLLAVTLRLFAPRL